MTVRPEDRICNLRELSFEERQLVEIAVNSHRHGGMPVDYAVMEVAIKYDLVYPSTGRLRANVYNFLCGHEMVGVG